MPKIQLENNNNTFQQVTQYNTDIILFLFNIGEQ